MCGVYVKRISALMKERGWLLTKEESRKMAGEKMRKITTATPDQDDFIKANYLTLPVKVIAARIGKSHTMVRTRLRQLELVIPSEIIAHRKKDSQIKSGSTPPNKGKKLDDFMNPETVKKFRANQFEKGNLPHNTCEKNGEIRIRTDHKDPKNKQYKWIRIALGKWELLHKVRWEKVNGKVPKSHCLWAKDLNSLNDDPDNWELITRKQNMQRNSGSANLSDGFVAATITRGDPEMRKILLDEFPAVIALKRDQILLNRKIKSHGQKQNNK